MDIEFIDQAWQWLSKYPYVLAGLLVVASLVAAKMVDTIFTRVIKVMTRHTKTTIDDEIIAQLHRPVQFSVVLTALVMALKVIIDDDHLQGQISRMLYTVILLMWTGVAIRCGRITFKGLIQHHRADKPLTQALPLLDNLLVIVFVLHCAFWLFKIWDINVTPLLASAGIVTAAVALASKDTLANLFGGMSIFLDHPYRLGHYIVLESGERGKVIQIGVRSTRVLTRDDVLITVPNGVMSNAKIVNQSGRVRRFRVRAKVGVGYASDPDQVERVLMAALDGIPEIMSAPSPRVRFREFGESTLVFQLMAWIHDPADRGRVLHLINKNILLGCRAAGIDIPFPQRVLHTPQPLQVTQVPQVAQVEEAKQEREEKKAEAEAAGKVEEKA